MHDQRLGKVLRPLMLTCAIAIAAGLNRKYTIAATALPFADVLRITDVMAMLIFAPLAVLFLWNIFSIYQGLSSRFATGNFIIGVFLLGIGFGMHDPMNAMQRVYHGQLAGHPDIAASVVFFDDKLGHWFFFAGFGIISLSVAIAEIANPYTEDISLTYFLPIVLAGTAVAAAICKNMYRENTSSDVITLLIIVAITFAFHLFKGRTSLRRLPAVTMMYIAYGIGGIASMLLNVFI